MSEQDNGEGMPLPIHQAIVNADDMFEVKHPDHYPACVVTLTRNGEVVAVIMTPEGEPVSVSSMEASGPGGQLDALLEAAGISAEEYMADKDSFRVGGEIGP